MDNKGFRFLERLVRSFDDARRPQAIALTFGCLVVAIASTLDLSLGMNDPWQRILATCIACAGAWAALAVLILLRSIAISSTLICSSIALEISLQYLLTRDIYIFCFLACVPIGMTLLVGRRTGIIWSIIFAFLIVGLALMELFKAIPFSKVDFRRVDVLDAIPVVTMMFAMVCIGIFSEALRLRAEKRRQTNRILLEKERKRFQTVTQSAFHGIIEFASSGKIEFASDGVKKVFGYEPDALRGTSIFKLIHAEDHPLVKKRMQNPSRDESHRDVRFLHSSGSPVRVEIACDQFELGKHLCSFEDCIFVLAFKNVEHKRKVQEKLLEAQKLGGLAEFAGGMAHDFNNLLTAITGYAEMVPDAMVKSGILQATEEAAHLTRQIMTFGRKQEIHYELVNLNETIRTSQAAIMKVVREDIEVDFDLDENVSKIYADPTHLQHVVLNLVSNARDAMPLGGVLQIKTRYMPNSPTGNSETQEHNTNPKVLLVVQDNGFGMDDETQQRVFDPFFSTKDKSAAPGLGLSSVYGVVQQCNAEIDIKSAPGEGTRVQIAFPAFNSFDTEKPEFAAEPNFTESGANSSIILVEDEDLVLEVMGNALRNAGHHVHSFDDAKEALEFIVSGQVTVDLVITDFVMPGMRGTELANKIRVMHPGIPVILMSGYHDVALERFDQLNDDLRFLPKPFLIPDLLQTVKELTSGQPEICTSGEFGR